MVVYQYWRQHSAVISEWWSLLLSLLWIWITDLEPFCLLSKCKSRQQMSNCQLWKPNHRRWFRLRLKPCLCESSPEWQSIRIGQRLLAKQWLIHWYKSKCQRQVELISSRTRTIRFQVVTKSNLRMKSLQIKWLLFILGAFLLASHVDAFSFDDQENSVELEKLVQVSLYPITDSRWTLVFHVKSQLYFITVSKGSSQAPLVKQKIRSR